MNQQNPTRAVTHTAGPWTSQKPKWCDPTRVRHIYDKEGRLIARVDFANGGQSENEAIANACLIAESTELLEALCLALPFVEDHEDSSVYKAGAVAKAVRTIKATIARATGGVA